MWIRSDLKAKGKIAFRANYWRCVLVAFLALILEGTVSSNSSREAAENVVNGNVPTANITPFVATAIGLGAILLVIIAIAIDIFLVNPLKVSCSSFFLNNRRDSETNLSALDMGFNGNYMNVVKTRFMTDIFIALWTLVFIIPGIIKHYEYYQVNFILAENPDMDYKEAQLLSKKMMYGNKMATFVLEMSFIGWFLLGALTFGLVNLFYTQPYYEATIAELYIALAHPAESNVIEAGGPAVKDAQTVEFEVEKN